MTRRPLGARETGIGLAEDAAQADSPAAEAQRVRHGERDEEQPGRHAARPERRRSSAGAAAAGHAKARQQRHARGSGQQQVDDEHSERRVEGCGRWNARAGEHHDGHALAHAEVAQRELRHGALQEEHDGHARRDGAPGRLGRERMDEDDKLRREHGVAQERQPHEHGRLAARHALERLQRLTDDADRHEAPQNAGRPRRRGERGSERDRRDDGPHGDAGPDAARRDASGRVHEQREGPGGEAGQQRRHALGEGQRGGRAGGDAAQKCSAPDEVADAAGREQAERVCPDDGRHGVAHPHVRLDAPHEAPPAHRLEANIEGQQHQRRADPAHVGLGPRRSHGGRVHEAHEAPHGNGGQRGLAGEQPARGDGAGDGHARKLGGRTRGV